MPHFKIRDRKNELIKVVEAETVDKAARVHRPGSRRATGTHGRPGFFVPPVSRGSVVAGGGEVEEQFHVSEV